MALQLALAKGELDPTAGTQVLEDSTGSYNATTNPTGYGTPNAARNTLALFVRVYNNRFDGSSDVTGTLLVDVPDNSDPTAVTKWTITLVDEGWLKATIYGVRFLDVAISLQVGEIVWDDSNNVLKRILTKSGSGPYVYTTTTATVADLENTNYIVAYSTVFNTYAIPQLCICYEKSVEKYLLSFDDDDRKLSDKIRAYLVSIRNGFLTGSPAEAQKKVEKAQAICTCFTEHCDC